jgi:hypothetical protein
MRSIKSEKRRSWLWALLPLTLLAAPATGCIVVEDEGCIEGELICTDELSHDSLTGSPRRYVEECVDDDWIVIEDCVSRCGGSCIYIGDYDIGCYCQ